MLSTPLLGNTGSKFCYLDDGVELMVVLGSSETVSRTTRFISLDLDGGFGRMTIMQMMKTCTLKHVLHHRSAPTPHIINHQYLFVFVPVWQGMFYALPCLIDVVQQSSRCRQPQDGNALLSSQLRCTNTSMNARKTPYAMLLRVVVLIAYKYI